MHKKTDLPCPWCESGRLVEPTTIHRSLGYVPVKCSACNFTGRRVNLIVVPDRKYRESCERVETSVLKPA